MQLALNRRSVFKIKEIFLLKSSCSTRTNLRLEQRISELGKISNFLSARLLLSLPTGSCSKSNAKPIFHYPSCLPRPELLSSRFVSRILVCGWKNWELDSFPFSFLLLLISSWYTLLIDELWKVVKTDQAKAEMVEMEVEGKKERKKIAIWLIISYSWADAIDYARPGPARTPTVAIVLAPSSSSVMQIPSCSLRSSSGIFIHIYAIVVDGESSCQPVAAFASKSHSAIETYGCERECEWWDGTGWDGMDTLREFISSSQKYKTNKSILARY